MIFVSSWLDFHFITAKKTKKTKNIYFKKTLCSLCLRGYFFTAKTTKETKKKIIYKKNFVIFAFFVVDLLPAIDNAFDTIFD